MKVCGSVHVGSSLQAAEGGAWAGAHPPEGPLPGTPAWAHSGEGRTASPSSREPAGVSPESCWGCRRHTPPRARLELWPSLPAWVAAMRLSWQHSLPHQAEAEPNSGPELSGLKHPSEPRRPQRANQPLATSPQAPGHPRRLALAAPRSLTHTHTHSHNWAHLEPLSSQTLGHTLPSTAT